jgi:4-hydroxy-4-methyl-2-oxoglutarate aldolase
MASDFFQLRKKIIHKIEMNHISTTEIADCLGKTGAIQGILPLNRGHFNVGNVHLVYAYNDSNYQFHEQIENLKEGDIVLVETHNCHERAVFGDLVTKFLILYKRVSAVVVNGHVRDAHTLIKENYPIWCKGVTPIGCHNTKNSAPIEDDILNRWEKKYNGSIAVCDDTGVVIIPRTEITEEFLEKLDFIELQEDIWYYCVDTKKWSTYETVSLKKYLDTQLLPNEFREKFKHFIEKQDK